MKKYLLIVAVVAMGLSFVACGGNKGESAKASDEDQQEEIVIVSETVEEGDLLTKYETLIDKAIGLHEKVASGDIAATEEYNKFREDMATVALELQNELPNFTPEQMQKFTELGQKWTDAIQKIANP